MRDWKIERLEILINLWKYEDVLKILKILLNKSPNSLRIKEKIASIYLFMWNKKKAKEYVKEKYVLQNIKELNEFREIKILITRKDYKNAILKAKCFFKKYPNNKLVKEKLAELYMAIWNYNEAKLYVSEVDFNRMKIDDDNMTKFKMMWIS